MKSLKYIIPNLLTLINLLLGIMAIIVVFRWQNEYSAAWLIFAAAFFDLTDGLAAKLLDAKSEFGKNLDSLADMVSFGVAPALILFNWLYLVLIDLSAQSTFEFISADFGQNLILLGSLMFAVAAAIRLARFNILESSDRFFIGLPTPAGSLIVAALWLVVGSTESESIRDILLNLYFVYAVIVILFVFMVSQIRMISLKFKGLSFADNKYQYITLAVGGALIILFKIPGILLSLGFYVLLSVVLNFAGKSK